MTNGNIKYFYVCDDGPRVLRVVVHPRRARVIGHAQLPAGRRVAEGVALEQGRVVGVRPVRDEGLPFREVLLLGGAGVAHERHIGSQEGQHLQRRSLLGKHVFVSPKRGLKNAFCAVSTPMVPA